MKKLFLTTFLMVLLVSATTNEAPKLPLQPSIEGTWELVSHYNYDNNEVIDTVPATNGYRQIKMYYNGKVMWTRYVPTDSVEWFGYGSYKTTDNSLTESLEYMSASMRKIADTLSVFTFELQIDEKNYRQISLDAEGNRTFSENYKRLN
ncbi:hypothetical protein U1E44_07975 [Arenibacter sp. GZD96]|uniref:hypothetical protein n=1 Tax=Aurantibrevibacter litoralis TaxID=3106030 RepID=UPI002AFDFE7D|nr:hypothetical protein [Arenibacter sp. GZD-96]MEA1786023.1 hypothetical protein [Arenibacter sp. GZD-96]